MTWTPTVNRFQAVLHKDGAIEFNYDEVHAQDAIVGVYPMVTQGNEKEIGAIDAGEKIRSPRSPRYQEREAGRGGWPLSESDAGDPRASARGERSCDGGHHLQSLSRSDRAGSGLHAEQWHSMDDSGRRRSRTRRSFGAPRYNAFGAGLSPTVKVSGNTISVEGTLPVGFKSGDQIFVSAAVQASGTPPVVVAQSAAAPNQTRGHRQVRRYTSLLSRSKTALSPSSTKLSTT